MQIIKRKKKSGESYPFVRFGIKKNVLECKVWDNKIYEVFFF